MKAKKTELLGLGCCCGGPCLGPGARHEGEKDGTTIWVVEVWGLASGLAPAMKAKQTELLGLGCGSAGPRLRLGTDHG
jgi:hypothetical protein